ncbi:phosphoketolase family protein, partial [Candidatus Peregrinibacteria bacterium]|nr:phosphoketolase family protein [Candidatus Peregrinibacteria bacterium]
MNKNDRKFLAVLPKYRRMVDYIGAAMLYLKDNFLLREPLEPHHFKPRILGHWGTVPGLNFIYANLNYLIWKHKCEMMLIVGPGHGAPGVLANLFMEGTLHDFYKEFTVDGKGMGQLMHDFSWPHTHFPSHVTPGVPGSILEGGELGYSLATAYGSVLDNPDLITAVVCGDGESETGPMATAWHSNKFLNPKTSGAVLPIVHINGYKISNPTIYGTMSDSELKALFTGYGYEPFIVNEPKAADSQRHGALASDTEEKMVEVLEKAYQLIREVQFLARKKGIINKPKWPVILLRSPKGWHGIHEYHHHLVEGSFHAHGIPIEHPSVDKDALKAIEKWLRSYEIEELVDKNGRPKSEIMKFLPTGKNRMGMNKHAIGGNFYKDLRIPKLENYELKIEKRGQLMASSIAQSSKLLRDVFKENKNNFRMMCPDEFESNKLGVVFEATKRAYMWPIKKTDENISVDGRVMEMLSEHTLQGWMQGYILTGRHGIFATYEAFAIIIASMVDQYAKFLKQSFKVKWRKPVASAIYLLTSLGWRQDHNGYSHQNPSFISNVLEKHGKFSQLYFPSDANSLLVAYEETLKRKDAVCVIVAGKTELPQWLTLKEAREQAKLGIGVWEWVGGVEGTKDPDVVLASCGDYVTREALFAVKFCKELVPELKVRYVNVSELTSIGLGDYCSSGQNCLTEAGVNNYFTHDCKVIFNYTGYTNDIEQILWPYTSSERFIIHG